MRKLCIAALLVLLAVPAWSATFDLPIMGWNTVPDTSGNAFFEPYPVKASNDRWDHLVLVFNDTATKDCVYGVFHVPQNYVGTPVLVVVWTTTDVTGSPEDVEWDFAYRAVGGDGAESLDQAGDQQAVNQNDSSSGTTDQRMVATASLTAGNFAAADTVEWELCRDGTDAGDTIDAAVTVHEVIFRYNDS